MNAADVLSMARAEGVLLALEGQRLTWKADHQPPADLLREIKAHRLEIIEALAASNDSPEALPWLARVARPPGCSPAYLRERGLVDPHDLTEQHQTHPRFAANLIRSSPAWMPPPTRQARPCEPFERQHTHHSAATATPAWIAARDAFHGHLFGCRACHAPTNRYCPAGAELRAAYDSTPWD